MSFLEEKMSVLEDKIAKLEDIVHNDETVYSDYKKSPSCREKSMS